MNFVTIQSLNVINEIFAHIIRNVLDNFQQFNCFRWDPSAGLSRRVKQGSEPCPCPSSECRAALWSCNTDALWSRHYAQGHHLCVALVGLVVSV